MTDSRKDVKWYAVRFLAGVVAIPLAVVLIVPALVVMLIYYSGVVVMDELK